MTEDRSPLPALQQPGNRYVALVAHALTPDEAAVLYSALVEALHVAEDKGLGAPDALERMFKVTRLLTDGKLTRTEVLLAAEQVAIDVAGQRAVAAKQDVQAAKD